MPIPVLDDRTPREAAVDPTAGEDLVRFLAMFPPIEAGGTGMKSDRLRDMLGPRA